MALPFLPAEQIADMFQHFSNLLGPSHDIGFHRLLEYFESTWITSTIFPPSSWSVFGHAVRTNNDVEGWHNGLNRMVSRRGNENVNLNIYELVEVLHTCCLQVQTDCQLVTAEKLHKAQRKTHLQYQAKIFALWDLYSKKEIRPAQLLRQVAGINAPFDDQDPDD